MQSYHTYNASGTHRVVQCITCTTAYAGFFRDTHTDFWQLLHSHQSYNNFSTPKIPFLILNSVLSFPDKQ